VAAALNVETPAATRSAAARATETEVVAALVDGFVSTLGELVRLTGDERVP